jgi:hypothetical protein
MGQQPANARVGVPFSPPGRATQLRSMHRDARGRNEEAPSRRG